MQNDEVTSTIEQSPPVPAPKKRRRWPWIVAIILGVLLVMGFDFK